MGVLKSVFSFIQKVCGKPQVPEDGQAVYFKNGRLVKISNQKDYWYDAKYLISDGVLYNLDLVDSVRSIVVPKFIQTDYVSGYGITGSMDYVLRMKAGNCFKPNEKELCSALLWKSAQLMRGNTFAKWKASDYARLVAWHYRLGMPDEARKAQKYLNSFLLTEENMFDKVANDVKNSTFASCSRMGVDLVVFPHYGSGCCADCDTLSGRVYSISGRSKTFPKLPEYAQKHGNFHKGCRCQMSPYFEGRILYRGKEVDAKKASLRQYKDGRTKKEKDCYDQFVEAQRENIDKEKRTLEFYELQEMFPDDTPKTLAAYSKMKKANSEKFIALQEKARSFGMEI